MNNRSENVPQNSSSPAPEVMELITWNMILNPLFLITYNLPSILNGILLVTILKDPLKCFRSCSSYLLFNFGLLGFLPLLILILSILMLSGYGNIYLWLYGFIFGFYNTIFAVFMLTLDRYFLACKPLFYSRIITKRRVFYSVTFFWILSGILVAITSPQIYDFVPKMDEAKLFVLSLFTIYCFVLTVIMILNIKTWQTVARRHVSHDIQSLGNRQNGNASKNLEHRAERKRLENERRFSKVILLLLLNLVFFILPQVLIIGIKSVNIWCEFCVTEFEHPNVYLFQVYFFPMFYITTPVLYIVSIPKYRKSCRTLFF